MKLNYLNKSIFVELFEQKTFFSLQIEMILVSGKVENLEGSEFQH